MLSHKFTSQLQVQAGLKHCTNSHNTAKSLLEDQFQLYFLFRSTLTLFLNLSTLFLSFSLSLPTYLWLREQKSLVINYFSLSNSCSNDLHKGVKSLDTKIVLEERGRKAEKINIKRLAQSYKV